MKADQPPDPIYFEIESDQAADQPRNPRAAMSL